MTIGQGSNARGKENDERNSLLGNLANASVQGLVATGLRRGWRVLRLGGKLTRNLRRKDLRSYNEGRSDLASQTRFSAKRSTVARPSLSSSTFSGSRAWAMFQ